MKPKYNFTVFISYVLLCNLVLSSCANSPFLSPNLVPTFSQTPPPTRAQPSSTPTAIPATLTMNNKTIILTPDDLFSLPGLKILSTPNSEDFCEHLPPPQTVTNPDIVSILSGRFVLCIYERANTAMDLDMGNLVPTDGERGDIIMQSGRWGTNEKPSYVISSWNKAHLSNAYVIAEYANRSGVNNLSYEYCENILRDQVGHGGMDVEKEKIACVKTTEGKIALIRVEKIYPAVTLSVEFSFVILGNE